MPTRRMMYWAAKFGHWWSAKQLRYSTDLIHGTLPDVKTSTLPSSFSFWEALKPWRVGMSYGVLDLFELGAWQSVDILQSEDWLGLNYAPGPKNTWTGGQTFGYLNAVMRSAIGDQPVTLVGHVTHSDDGFLRLKVYSALAQGAKGFFFRLYGPTYTSTEQYWSDLRSNYEGLAKITRQLEKTEDVIVEAKPASDPVAILYAISHDIWHTDRRAAAFVEKRLLWHALRHLSVQPDFLREEDVEVGRLKDYRVLYVTDNCITRKASAAIDRWVKDGGVLYMSAGAATRDEYFEPHLPPFAQTVWPDNAEHKFVSERHLYHERRDLPAIKPLTQVTCRTEQGQFKLPAIGSRLDLQEGVEEPLATFEDGAAAGAIVQHGKGKVMALGFMPMLAYGQLANFKPTTLEEKWPPEPRRLIALPLEMARITPVAKASVPVVETGLFGGAERSALVLVNYTYEPIDELTVDTHVPHPVARAVSCEHGEIDVITLEDAAVPGTVRIKLPFEWTDIVLLLPE